MDIALTPGLTAAQRRKRVAGPLAAAQADALVVHEIFASIQGESSYAGLPCTFVRTTGCHLRCGYCDTRHAFARGNLMSLDDICQQVAAQGLPMVEVTGGEPLLQRSTYCLLTRLCDAGLVVLLETSGGLDVAAVDPRVIKVIDIKVPSSGEAAANVWANLDILQPHDELKFVVGSREDYQWSRAQIAQRNLAQRGNLLMGIVWGALTQQELAAWIVADRLNVRMQLQLHKYIWDPDRRGV